VRQIYATVEINLNSDKNEISLYIINTFIKHSSDENKQSDHQG